MLRQVLQADVLFLLSEGIHVALTTSSRPDARDRKSSKHVVKSSETAFAYTSRLYVFELSSCGKGEQNSSELVFNRLMGHNINCFLISTQLLPLCTCYVQVVLPARISGNNVARMWQAHLIYSKAWEALNACRYAVPAELVKGLIDRYADTESAP